MNLPCFITLGELPDLQHNPELCLKLAGKNNPEVINRKVRRLQSVRSVDLAKKNRKMKADLA